MGLKNFKVRCEVPEDATLRRGTSKKSLVDWALEQGEFTKAEFTAAAIALREEGMVESKMDDATMARAWWNEFYCKYRWFVPVE